MNLIMEIFGRAIKPLYNMGMGYIPGVSPLFRFIWRRFGPKGIRLTEVNGIKMYVICHDWAISPSLLYVHRWEPVETEIFRQHIKEGMIVLDVGAYIGIYSLLASKLVGSEGKVYAFEPSPESLGVLQKNIQLNNCKNVQVFGKAVTDKTGYTTFHIIPDNLASSSMFKDYSYLGSIRNPQIEVPTITLDEAVGDEKVDFIKMDIEGGEPKALHGMPKIIKNSPNLEMIIEVYPQGLVGIGSSLEEYIGFLQHYFQLHIIGERGLTSEVGLLDIQRATRRTTVINLFCQRRSDYV